MAQINSSKASRSSGGKGQGAESTLLFGQIAHDLINNLPLGVVVCDTWLTITDSNPAARKMLVSSANAAEALALGSPVATDGKWQGDLTQALASSEATRFENLAYSNNGRNYVLHVICTPLVQEKSGKTIGGLLLIEDVTAKIAMESDLAAAERLAAVGKLAARVAHELNNPLDGILRYINLALRLVDQEGVDQAGHYLQESRKGLMRMVQIISELLEFSRSTFSAFEEADINKIVEDGAKAMEGLAANHKVVITRDYDPNMPNIRSGNFFQVFCNLAKNAVDAMPDGGQLDITTRCDEHYAAITFADTGPGIDEGILEKLFEPFFTTKAQGKGTGLGLAICKDIVEKYHGRIEVENRRPQGCVFTVTIPLERTSRGE